MKVQKEEALKVKRNRIWNTKLVNDVQHMIEMGDIVENPFVTNDSKWREPDITFEYTIEEEEEIKKCAEDVVYFADKYAYAMTDDGVQKIKLRDYQISRLKDLQDNRMCVYLASRQVGKCFLHFININVRNKQNNEESVLTIGKFFYEQLSKRRKLSAFEWIKYKLWNFYSFLS